MFCWCEWGIRLPDRDRKLPNMNGLGKKKDEIKQQFQN